MVKNAYPQEVNKKITPWGLVWYTNDSGEEYLCHGQGSCSKDNHLSASSGVALLKLHHGLFVPRKGWDVVFLRDL